MTDRNNVRTGAACSALSAGLFALIFYAPPLGLFASLASPLPIAYAGWRSTSVLAAFVVILASAAVALAVQPMAAVTYITQFGLGGILIGIGLKRDWEPEKIIGAYAAAAFFAVMAMVGILAIAADVQLVDFIEHTVAAEMAQLGAMLTPQEGDPATLLAIDEGLGRTQTFVIRGFFGLSATFAIFTGWLNAMLMRHMLARRGEPMESWLDWRTPEIWVWVLIVAGAAMASGREPFATLGLNVVIPMITVYFLQGLAIVQFMFVTKGFPRLFMAVAYAIMFFQLPIMLLVAATGAFDLWFDFRRRIAPGPQEDS